MALRRIGGFIFTVAPRAVVGGKGKYEITIKKIKLGDVRGFL